MRLIVFYAYGRESVMNTPPYSGTSLHTSLCGGSFCSRCLLSGSSLFGGSLGSSGSGFSLSLCSSDLSLFLGYDLSLCLVLGLLGFETLFGGEFFLVGHGCDKSVGLTLLHLFPCLETTLCFSLVESTFLHTALKVLHKHHTL